MKDSNLHHFGSRSLVFLFAFICYGTIAFSQKKISGLVLDTDRQPIDGASVAIKNSSIGTTSTANGSFSLLAKPGDILLVSFVGMIGKEVLIRDQDQVTIILSFAESKMEDLVVIGYGTARKKDLTGSVASVSAKEFNKGIYASPDQLIQGKIPGVQIIYNNGQPGGAATVKIRGNSAVTGTGQPLYVVDDVPLDGRSLQAGNNPLNFLNLANIASIDVLKDASATAIYGSRAAYGVVIINTKKGNTGPTKLEVTSSVGVSSILKNISVLDAEQYRQAIKYYGVNASFDKGKNADGMDGILQKGLQQEYSISASGGSEYGKYRFSAGLLNQEGIVINTGFKKYNADASAKYKLLQSKKLGLNFNLSASQYIKDGSLLRGGDDQIIWAALQWNPTSPLKNANGSPIVTPGENTNPVALSQYLRDNLKVTTILGSISGDYQFTDWISYKLLFSINTSAGNSRFMVDQAYMYPGYPIGSASVNDNELITNQLTNTLNFNKEIVRGLSLDVVAGYEYMRFKSKGFGLTAFGVDGIGFGNYGLDYTNYLQYSRADNRMVSSYIDPKSELQSYFGRSIFNYNDKYFLTATFRADGSTKFGANNKYGHFPSFALAWNISKENFFKIGFVNSFKIRGGWGKTGNQEFPPGSSQALYGFRDNAIVVQINNPNPDLKWQSDRQYDLGIDFTIFDNRISGTIDYFNKTTTNLLFPSPPIQPAPPGSTVRWINLDGEIINKGVEILLNGSVINNKNFGLQVSANATFIKNNVSGLPLPIFTGFIQGGPAQVIENGHPMNTFYTRKFLGLDKKGFSVYQDSGFVFYHLGDPNPKTLLGISLTLRYRKISLIANMNGSFGQDIFNSTLMNILNVGGINSGRNIALSVYEDPVRENIANPAQSHSSRFIQKGNYLRMSNLTISYNIGDVENTFKGANVFVTAQNLFIITKYPGFDPEVNYDASINSVPSLGIDFARYPSSRSVILGIKFSL